MLKLIILFHQVIFIFLFLLHLKIELSPFLILQISYYSKLSNVVAIDFIQCILKSIRTNHLLFFNFVVLSDRLDFSILNEVSILCLLVLQLLYLMMTLLSQALIFYFLKLCLFFIGLTLVLTYQAQFHIYVGILKLVISMFILINLILSFVVLTVLDCTLIIQINFYLLIVLELSFLLDFLNFAVFLEIFDWFHFQ